MVFDLLNRSCLFLYFIVRQSFGKDNGLSWKKAQQQEYIEYWYRDVPDTCVCTCSRSGSSGPHGVVVKDVRYSSFEIA